MLEVLPKVAKLQASYAPGKPLALPMNLTISVSYRCNSRCKTCNVWQRPNDDFTIEEYDKTFESISLFFLWDSSATVTRQDEMSLSRIKRYNCSNHAASLQLKSQTSCGKRIRQPGP